MLARSALVVVSRLAVVLSPSFVALSATGAARAADAKPSRPNVVIFLADDLGWGDLGCYGHPKIQTPNLDKFATQGLRYTQCYAASAFCSPSRSAIQTGRTPYRNGVFTWLPENQDIHLRTSEITVAKLLNEAGYETCHAGKWHLNGYFNDPRHPQPSDHGYQWWFATQNNAAPSHMNPVNFVRNGDPVGKLEGYSAPLVAEEAIAWLKNHRNPEKPFFLTVWTHEPHLPIESDPQFQKLYDDLEDPDVRQHHGDVTQMDHGFGMVMKALDDMKLTDDTFVVFTSDNGPEGNGTSGRTRGSTGGLRGRKRSVYEGGIRVAGLVRWPGHVPAGQTCDVPIIGSDIFNTVCEITRVQVPTDRVIDGVSFTPTFAGRTPERPIPFYWRCYIAPEKVKTAMRVGDWKMLAAEDMSYFELYNVQSDPKEENELSTAEPERFAAMKAQLVKLNGEIEAEGPDWWREYEARDRAKRAQPKKKPAAKAK